MSSCLSGYSVTVTQRCLAPLASRCCSPRLGAAGTPRPGCPRPLCTLSCTVSSTSPSLSLQGGTGPGRTKGERRGKGEGRKERSKQRISCTDHAQSRPGRKYDPTTQSPRSPLFSLLCNGELTTDANNAARHGARTAIQYCTTTGQEYSTPVSE